MQAKRSWVTRVLLPDSNGEEERCEQARQKADEAEFIFLETVKAIKETNGDRDPEPVQT